MSAPKEEVRVRSFYATIHSSTDATEALLRGPVSVHPDGCGLAELRIGRWKLAVLSENYANELTAPATVLLPKGRMVRLYRDAAEAVAASPGYEESRRRFEEQLAAIQLGEAAA